jgi:uncharacterized membrane protein HdeD (DUF308 family)
VSETSVSGGNSTLLALMAVVDLLVGLVLSAVGVVSDTQVLAIAGVVLLLSGGGMLAFVAWRRNQPEAL